MSIRERVTISDERLARLMQTIKQVETMKDGRIVTVVPVDPREVSCIYNMKYGKRCKNLKPLMEIETVHTCGGWHGFFKPSIAEVLAQVPEEVEDHIRAFEILRDISILEDGTEMGHSVTTRFYSKK